MRAMELTPKLIEEAEFRETRKGYDRDQVDDFLEEAAASVATLLSQLAEARQRADAAEAKLAAAAAAAAGDGAADAAAIAVPTGPDPKVLEENAEELKRTLVLAQRTADAAIREARAEATRLQAESEARAQQTVLDADQEAERRRTEAHAGLLVEIQTLESTRDELRNDADLIERHVQAQRQQLRAAVEELQRLLDDPESLRVAPPPPHRDVPLPGFVVAPTTDGAPAEGTPAEGTPAEGAAAGAQATGSGAEGAPVDGSAVAPQGGSQLDLSGLAQGAAPAQDRAEGAAASSPGQDDSGDGAAPAGDGETPAEEESAPTEAVPQLVGDADEDAFLAELRKAMTDSEPLGPRDAGARGAPPAVPRRAPDDSARPRPRFGRRR